VGYPKSFVGGVVKHQKYGYLIKNEGRDIGLVFESQIFEMFRMYQNERNFLFIVVVCDVDGGSKYSGSQS
jgi:hypothetical protein